MIQISSEILLGFITNSFIAIVLILVLCVFISHKIKGRLIPHYLVSALIFAILSTSAYLIAHVELEIFPSQLSIDLLYSFFTILVFFFIYLHYESLSRNKYTLWRIFFMFGFIIICLTSITLNFFDLYKDWDLIGQYVYFNIMIFIILCFLYPLYATIKIFLLTRERATLYEIFAVILVESSNLMFMISEILFFTKIIQYNLLTVLSDISDFLILFGVIFLLSNYLIHNDFLYRLPFPVHYFLVINGAGIQVYNRHIATINIPRYDIEKEQLMSGALSAISSLMQETLGTNTTLKFIDAEGYQIYFSEIPNENGILAIFTSGCSIYLKRSLNNFSKSLPEDLVEDLNKVNFYVGAFDDKLDELLTQAFPYLVILKD